ncbi:MAG: hypothetical protein ACRDJH_11290 [Thermomicrobiales bacterium]
MRRYVLLLAGMIAVVGVVMNPVSAQPDNFDPALSDTNFSPFGYPEIEIEVSPDGVEAPSTVEAGLYHVTLTAMDEDNIGYVDFMQPPAGRTSWTAW